MELLVERSPLSTETAKLEDLNLEGICLRMKLIHSKIVLRLDFPVKELEPLDPAMPAALHFTLKVLEPINLLFS